MKEFKLIYLDKEGNEIKELHITAASKKDAERQKKAAFAVCMLNCKKIIVR